MIRKYNFRLLFCIFLLLFAFAFLFAIVIIKPKKTNTLSLYDTTSEGINSYSNKEIIHNISPKVDNVVGLLVYFDDNSIIGCDFKINVSDQDGKNYFSHMVKNYQSNILDLKLGYIKDSSNKNFIMKLSLINCDKVKYKTTSTLNNETYLMNNRNKTMKITVSYLTKNNSYYWYIAMLIACAFVLLPLSRSEK